MYEDLLLKGSLGTLPRDTTPLNKVGFTLPSLKVPPIFLFEKAFFKENDRQMGGTLKEERVPVKKLSSLHQDSAPFK